MNLILFQEHETGKNLPKRDERTIHLLKVLHKKKGDVFDAGILKGLRGTGKIEEINPDGSIFVSVQAHESPPPRLPIRVAVGFPRPIQIRRLLRDLSSLGVEAIDLTGTDMGEKSYRDTKLINDGGARAALIEGAIQARDTNIPALAVFGHLTDWLKEKPWEQVCAQTQKNSDIPLLIAMDNVRPQGTVSGVSCTKKTVVLAVGPERGWSDRERYLLEDAGFSRLSMGERALRTETACVAATVLVMEKTGQFLADKSCEQGE